MIDEFNNNVHSYEITGWEVKPRTVEENQIDWHKVFTKVDGDNIMFYQIGQDYHTKRLSIKLIEEFNMKKLESTGRWTEKKSGLTKSQVVLYFNDCSDVYALLKSGSKHLVTNMKEKFGLA